MKQKLKKIKEVVSNLEGRKIMKCPYCKHTQFLRKTCDSVEVYDDGDSLTDEVIVPAYEGYVFICKNCNKEVGEFK